MASTEPFVPADDTRPILQVKNLKKYYKISRPFSRKVQYVKAVDDVSLHLYEKKTLGLVGESGCGKSTTGKTLMRLQEPTEGEAYYKGKDLFKLKGKEFKQMRREIQMIFQDPHSSLNPKKRIGETVMEPMAIHKIGASRSERMERALDLLLQVGIRPDQFFRFPYEFSGGQRQRIGLARALAVNPKVIVCDEPVSALDVSIQSQVINLLQEIQERYHLSYLFISHDLSVVRHISDDVAVMYLGHIVEIAATDELFAHPLHPYTKALLSAIPIPNPTVKRKRIVIKGDVPSPLNPPSGCVFHTRCPFATERCTVEKPVLQDVGSGHQVACHLYD